MRQFVDLASRLGGSAAPGRAVAAAHIPALAAGGGSGGGDTPDAVDAREILAGCSILCGGGGGGGSTDRAPAEAEHAARLRSAFRLYDLNGDGEISRDEMRRYTESVFRVMFAVDPYIRSHFRAYTPRQLAEETTHQAFAGGPRVMHFREFQEWYDGRGRADGASSIRHVTL